MVLMAPLQNNEKLYKQFFEMARQIRESLQLLRSKVKDLEPNLTTVVTSQPAASGGQDEERFTVSERRDQSFIKRDSEEFAENRGKR